MNTFVHALSQLDFRAITDPSTFDRGRRLYQNQKVELTILGPTHARLHVEGNYKPFYSVEFTLVAEGNDLIFDCECDAFMSEGVCKHVVAAGLYLMETLKPNRQVNAVKDPTAWRGRVDRALSKAQLHHYRSTGRQSGPFLILFSLQRHLYNHTYELLAYRLSALALSPELYDSQTQTLIGSKEELTSFLQALDKDSKRLKRLSNRSSIPAHLCVNLDPIIANMIEMRQHRNDGTYYYYHSQNDFTLTNYISNLASLGIDLYSGSEHQPFLKPINLTTSDGFVLNLSYRDETLFVNPEIKVDQSIVPLGDGNFIQIGETSAIQWGETLCLLGAKANLPAIDLIQEIGNLELGPHEANFFVDNYLLPLTEVVDISGSAITWKTIDRSVPTKQLYLQERQQYMGTALISELAFSYDGHVLPYTPFNEARAPISIVRDESIPISDRIQFVKIYRQSAFEAEVYGGLSNKRYGLKKGGYGYKDTPSLFELRAYTDPIDFLVKHIPILIEDGFEIFGEEALQSIKVNRRQPTLSVNVSSGIDWFDLQMVIQFGEINVQLSEVRQAIRKKERYVKLADGSVGELPEGWLTKYRHLFGMGNQTEEGARFDTHHLTLLDQLLMQADQVQLDRVYQERLTRLKTFETIESQPLPETFVGTLRPYQKAGYDWLHFLKAFQFGGCLADDMGLGKTVQILAYIASVREKQAGLPPELVVMPRSLLSNWDREAAKFTPSLKTLVHFGKERSSDSISFLQFDMIFTTYGIMRRDIEWLSQFNFHTVVLDEAQAIKSPVTQVSKASRLLKGEQRLTMSGTPVENSTLELWSQFAFLNPGLLGSFDFYKKAFSNPIERDKDEASALLLRRTVFPFILRRTKAQVAPDLPPRTDEIVYIDMEPNQRKFYEKTRDRYRTELLGMVEEKGIDRARIKVLEGLLRLRQICNHPKLVKSNFRGDSAKMERVVEQLVNLYEPDESGQPHKALVFSQFVKMLRLVEEELKKRKIPYAYLDGQTRKRQAQIDKFQTDPAVPFFLISLKAGGVGLNLTAADYVIHVDPWWNPAVEMQATDRTHRIGQDKPVFVYKLITRNSVEEKILELQRQKQALVDQLIATESGFFKTLTADDVQLLFS